MKVIVALLLGLLAVNTDADACAAREVNDNCLDLPVSSTGYCCVEEVIPVTSAPVEEGTPAPTIAAVYPADYHCTDADEDLCFPPTCEDAHDWTVTWIGSSTQFEFGDPCDDTNYIRVKVDRLYDTEGNKQTSLASTSNTADKTDENAGYLNCVGDPNNDADPTCNNPADCNDPDNNSCVYVQENTLKSTLTKVGDGSTIFILKAQLFREAHTYENTDGDMVRIERNALKFGFEINNWPNAAATNQMTVSLDIKTGKAGTFKGEGDVIESDDFRFKNDGKANCTGQDPVAVTAATEVTGNTLNLLYTFENCQGGNITYDPILSQLGDDGVGSIGYGLAVFVGLMVALLN